MSSDFKNCLQKEYKKNKDLVKILTLLKEEKLRFNKI